MYKIIIAICDTFVSANNYGLPKFLERDINDGIIGIVGGLSALL